MKLDNFFISCETVSGDIFKENQNRTQTTTTAKRAAAATGEVVDIFNDPLNASDV